MPLRVPFLLLVSKVPLDLLQNLGLVLVITLLRCSFFLSNSSGLGGIYSGINRVEMLLKPFISMGDWESWYGLGWVKCSKRLARSWIACTESVRIVI